MQTTKSGYILIVTLLLVSLSMFIATYIANRGIIYMPYARATTEREKAKILARSGIELAISQLAEFEAPPKEKKSAAAKQTNSKEEKKQPEQQEQLLRKILPDLNRWQKVELKKNSEGIDGTIRFAVISEQGKININALYDFENQRFIDEKDEKKLDKQQEQQSIRQLFKDVFEGVRKVYGGKNLFEPFEKFLKERHYKLNDITELLTIDGFDVFKEHIFYEPPTILAAKGARSTPGKKQERPLFLTDLFTVWSTSDTIEPWLFSDSLLGLLQLERASADDDHEKRVKLIDTQMKKFKLESSWDKDFKEILEPLYKKEYKALPKSVQARLAKKFEPTLFSVISYGTVGKITQRLLAILKRSVTKTDNDVTIEVSIQRLIWL